MRRRPQPVADVTLFASSVASHSKRPPSPQASARLTATILLLLSPGKGRSPWHSNRVRRRFRWPMLRFWPRRRPWRTDTPERCAKWANVSGFTGAFDFFDNHDTQGFVAESGDAIIVAFRGTQPNRPMDWFVGFPRDVRSVGPQERRQGPLGVLQRASQSVGRDARQRRNPAAAAGESGQQDDLDHRPQPRRRARRAVRGAGDCS